MTEASPSIDAPHRVRGFVDFWNYTLHIVDTFPGVKVSMAPRQKKRSPPSCPRCTSRDRVPRLWCRHAGDRGERRASMSAWRPT